MAFRQAVVQVGSWTVKAGLWEQTFLPTLVLLEENRLIFRSFLHVRHVLVTALELGSNLSDVPLLLIIPTNWSRDVRFSLLKMLLEQVGVGGVHLGDSAVMAAFGCATPSALVVDIGHSITEVTAVIDGEVVSGASEAVCVGGRDIEASLERILKDDVCFIESLTGNESLYQENKTEIIRKLKESEACHPISTAEHVPPLIFTFKTTDFSVGEHRVNAIDVLFASHLVDKNEPALAQAIMTILSRCDADKRAMLLDHVILTGLTSRIPLRAALETHLRQLLPVSEFSGEFQSRSIRFRSVPEYYPEVWQRAGPNAAWFGGGITAKCVLGDARNYYTKEDLIHHGPRVFTNKQL